MFTCFVLNLHEIGCSVRGCTLWIRVVNLDELTVLEACYAGNNDPSVIIIYENFMEMNAVT